jgi:hypothetical protein
VLGDIASALRGYVHELEPGCLSGEQAVRALELMCEVERMAAAGRTLLARRVEQSNVWVRSGHRTAAEFVAVQTGTTVGGAINVLATAERLEQTPATAQAFLAGEVSETQASEIAKAAAVDPAAEDRLLATAKRGTVRQLTDECRRVRVAATDEAARYDRIRADRHLRTWTDPDGAFCGRFSTTPDVGARMAAALAKAADRRFDAARAAGQRERPDAYAMDALAALVCGDDQASGAKLVINAVVDYQTLVGEATSDGATCEVAGLGSVPVETIRRWEGDRYLRLVVRHGVDIKSVTRTTRYVDDRQKAALLVREGFTCSVVGCDQQARLQIDHIHQFAKGGPTELANFFHPCVHHHRLKDIDGWTLHGGPGTWWLEPP